MRFLFIFQVNSCDLLGLPMRIVIIDNVYLIFNINLCSVHVQGLISRLVPSICCHFVLRLQRLVVSLRLRVIDRLGPRLPLLVSIDQALNLNDVLDWLIDKLLGG